MSRHEIPAKDPKYRVIVGWDQPLMTFFGQVYDKKLEGTDKELVHWVGVGPRLLYEIEQLEKAMKNWAVLSPEIKATLYGDRDEGR